ANNISGVPVVKDGKVVGIVTGRDTRFETNLEQPVSNIMTGQDRLVTVIKPLSSLLSPTTKTFSIRCFCN
ncbi:hypothetical protein IAF53_21025, partial [Acinetobacter baumannii]|nr:hypothetical protein [Acinetobacter baumannii]